ncbi:MAG TPA: ABC transporter substrate-binding protein [Xanthobacteraceae bacterium]|nr:ABC transporter substrate-binding protein [Xanthobacteraceae bacterium]
MQRRVAERHLSLTRRSVLASIAAAAASGMAPARAADQLTMRLEWSAYVMHLPFYLAMDKGWFKAANLEVYIEDGNGSITMVQLVGNGKFDLGHGALASMAVGASKGLGVTSVSEYLQKSPLGIIYDANLDIKSIKDFAGKKIIYTPASFESPFLEPFFNANGVPLSSVSMTGVEASAKMSSYMTNTCDAFVTTVPADFPRVNEKRPSKAILFADYGMNLPTFGIVANTEALKAKGPAIKRFVSVVSASWNYILTGHADEAAEAVMKQRPNAATTVERLKGEFKEQAPYFCAQGKTIFPGLQDRDDWVKAIKLMETADVIAPGSTPEKYFTNDYIDPAYGKTIVASSN